MISELSPTTRQRIIDTAHRDGHYAGMHGSLRMEIKIYQIPNSAKQAVTLRVCIDRKWKLFPVETVFAAVEEFNRILRLNQAQRSIRQGSIEDGLWLSD
jgi:hypothetical protein